MRARDVRNPSRLEEADRIAADRGRSSDKNWRSVPDLKGICRAGDYKLADIGGASLRTMKTVQSFDQISREYGPMIKRIACSYEADVSLAEELVQEIHVALWRALPTFRGAASMRTFVARIATNRALTHVARQMRSPTIVEVNADIPTNDANPEAQALALSKRSQLLMAVRSLPLAYRQVVTLTLEELSTTETATTLGITTNAVAIRLSRAKKLLRERLGDDA